jgi:hypothetical protein
MDGKGDLWTGLLVGSLRRSCSEILQPEPMGVLDFRELCLFTMTNTRVFQKLLPL